MNNWNAQQVEVRRRYEVQFRVSGRRDSRWRERHGDVHVAERGRARERDPSDARDRRHALEQPRVELRGARIVVACVLEVVRYDQQVRPVEAGCDSIRPRQATGEQSGRQQEHHRHCHLRGDQTVTPEAGAPAATGAGPFPLLQRSGRVEPRRRQRGPEAARDTRECGEHRGVSQHSPIGSDRDRQRRDAGRKVRQHSLYRGRRMPRPRRASRWRHRRPL